VDEALIRDWVIIIAGSLGILVLMLITIMSVVLFSKILAITNKVKKVINQIDKAVNSPYYQVASWIGGMCAGIKQGMQKKK
jgi:hypothetical protein